MNVLTGLIIWVKHTGISSHKKIDQTINLVYQTGGIQMVNSPYYITQHEKDTRKIERVFGKYENPKTGHGIGHGRQMERGSKGDQQLVET